MRISDWSSDVCSSDLGVVDGRVFRHPDLKFQFEAPAGFTINNGTQSIAIQGNGGQAQFAGGSLGGGGLEAYVGKVFQAVGGQQISYSQPRRTTVNGLEAAVSTARANTQDRKSTRLNSSH